jgi:hypothetical protein
VGCLGVMETGVQYLLTNCYLPSITGGFSGMFRSNGDRCSILVD